MSREHDERSRSCYPHPRYNLLPSEGSCCAGTGGLLGFAWPLQAPTDCAGPQQELLLFTQATFSQLGVELLLMIKRDFCLFVSK